MIRNICLIVVETQALHSIPNKNSTTCVASKRRSRTVLIWDRVTCTDAKCSLLYKK